MNNILCEMKKITAGLCLLILISHSSAALTTTFAVKANTDKVLLLTKFKIRCENFAKIKQDSQSTFFSDTEVSKTAGFDLKPDLNNRKYLSARKTRPTKSTDNAESIKNSNLADTNSIKSLGNLPKTSKIGDRGTHIEKLQQALQLHHCYKGEVDGIFGPLTEEAIKTFQKINSLKVNGQYDHETSLKLFDKSTEATSANDLNNTVRTAETEKLDWFQNGVNAIPKGATFSVKDVSTGKIFSGVRWSGANHLDAEPASATDTKVIKEVFGGDWSWARRSILVKYKDHIYAASMNGMPHGTTVVDSNNFSGHFCIHFYNSRTHETNRVDEDHQNAVNAAMRSSW